MPINPCVLDLAVVEPSVNNITALTHNFLTGFVWAWPKWSLPKEKTRLSLNELLHVLLCEHTLSHLISTYQIQRKDKSTYKHLKSSNRPSVIQFLHFYVLHVSSFVWFEIWETSSETVQTHTHARRTHTHTHSQCFQPKIKVEGGRQESRWLYLYYILTIGSQDLFRQKIGRYNDSFMVIHWEMKQVWKYLRITDHNQSNPQAGFTKPLDESTNTHQNWCLILLFLTFVHTAS